MSMTIDDAGVIRSFKAGDRLAFESIVGEYQAELLRHARRRGELAQRNRRHERHGEPGRGEFEPG